MRISVRASGFRLTNHTRNFVQSKLLHRLGQFRDRIASVEGNLTASEGRHQPDVTACEILVNVGPSVEIRRRAEHEWLHIAIDRAASVAGAAVAQAIVQMRRAGTAPYVIASRDASRDDGTSGRVLDENRTSRRRRDMRDQPENYLPVREQWRPAPTEERDAHVRRNASDGWPRPGQPRALSRIF